VAGINPSKWDECHSFLRRGVDRDHDKPSLKEFFIRRKHRWKVAPRIQITGEFQHGGLRSASARLGTVHRPAGLGIGKRSARASALVGKNSIKERAGCTNQERMAVAGRGKKRWQLPGSAQGGSQVENPARGSPHEGVDNVSGSKKTHK